MAVRAKYEGVRRKLVLAFDLGTTYSGISYSVLDPGQVPEIKGVTRFPANELISGASKIPTIIYYDGKGEVRAVGAEAIQEGILETAEEQKWAKAEWFKLHLRSKVGSGNDVNNIPPLPPNKTVVQVFADFLKYLFKCASIYIQDTHANGAVLWESLKNQIDFVLSHPNGWEGMQQAEMRKAAVLAGLVPDTPAGHARLTFVTEGEASLHFCIENGLPPGVMNDGEGVTIIDAGGGTIDMSSYSRNTKSHFEEITPSECHFQGSVFVTVNAGVFLKKYLAKSQFLDDVNHIVECFDKTTKQRFRSNDNPQYIKFGSTKDNDAQVNIRFGQLKLEGPEVASFFQPSIDCIVKAASTQLLSAKKPIKHVVFVGGFSASDWLFQKVSEKLTSPKIHILRPENHINKAVSDGAISFYLNNYVRSRVSKLTYGIFCSFDYDSSQSDHVQRRSKVFTGPSGEKKLNDGFSIILSKGTQVTETQEFKRSYRTDSHDKALKNLNLSITCYRGNLIEPKWKDLDPPNFSQLCNIDLDVAKVPFEKMSRAMGLRNYYVFRYSIILFFGLTELKAQIAWTENGVEKRSPSRIIYDPDL